MLNLKILKYIKILKINVWFPFKTHTHTHTPNSVALLDVP